MTSRGVRADAWSDASPRERNISCRRRVYRHGGGRPATRAANTVAAAKLKTRG
jgi:hypothetical protein